MKLHYMCVLLLEFVQSIGSGLVEHMQGLSSIMPSSLWCRISKVYLNTDFVQRFTRQRHG